MLSIKKLKELLEQYNASDVMLIDLREKISSISDYALIASVTSKVQMSSIASYISTWLSENGGKVICTEGVSDGNWGIIDAGSIIVHLFRPEVRNYYKIEEILKRKSRCHSEIRIPRGI